MRVNAIAIAGACLGLALSALAHSENPAQIVVALAAGGAFLAALTARPRAPSDWFTVRLLLAGNLVVFALSNAHKLGSAGTLLVSSGLLLALAATYLYLHGQANGPTDP